MTFISSRLDRIAPSPTMAVTARARQLKAEGRDVIGLGAGEPDFDTPDHVKEAAAKAMKDGCTKYTDVPGTIELREAVCAKFERENGLIYTPDQIQVACGGKQNIYNAIMASVEEGDEVIIPAPYWVSYPDMVLLADATPVFIETHQKNNFEVDIGTLKSAISEKTKLIILNSPSNPTGITYSKDEYYAIGEVLTEHPGILIATDDMYEHIYWGDEPITSFAAVCPDLFDRTITINGVSKSYAMTGWRIGYCGANVHVVKGMKKVQGQSTSNPSSVSQAAALAALNGSSEAVEQMVVEYKKRHDYMCEALNDIDGFKTSPGTGAFYLFPEISQVLDHKGFSDDVEFSSFLIDQANVAVIPGSAFGAKGYIRISYATNIELLKESVTRIKNSLK